MGVAKHSNLYPVGFQKKGIKRRLQQGEGKSLVASIDVYCSAVKSNHWVDIFESLTARSSTSFVKKSTSCSTISAAFGFGCCQRWLQNSRVKWCRGIRSCSKRGDLASAKFNIPIVIRFPENTSHVQDRVWLAPNAYESHSGLDGTSLNFDLVSRKQIAKSIKIKVWIMNCNMTWQLQPWLKPS